jgi:thiamine-phosphate pyrophosphorylase
VNDGALRGLYAVTPAALCRQPPRLGAAVAAALTGGARLIQYRDKDGDAAAREALARELLVLCRARGARLIVNDDVALAAKVGADGVHLGQADVPLREARRRLGDAALIGVSCGNRLDRAVAAQEGGASYVAFGRFFPSRTKPEAPPAELALLREARAALRLPLCAIGGITPANAAAVIGAGADLVAAVDGVFGALDVTAAARAYARLFVQ